jgi:hypothetical protein
VNLSYLAAVDARQCEVKKRRRRDGTVTLGAAVKWPAMSSVSTYWGSRANTQPTAVSPSTGNLQSPRTVDDGRLSWRFSTQPARGANPLRHNDGHSTETGGVTHILRLCSIALTKVLNHSIPQRITRTALECARYYTVLSECRCRRQTASRSQKTSFTRRGRACSHCAAAARSYNARAHR